MFGVKTQAGPMLDAFSMEFYTGPGSWPVIYVSAMFASENKRNAGSIDDRKNSPSPMLLLLCVDVAFINLC